MFEVVVVVKVGEMSDGCAGESSFVSKRTRVSKQ